MLRHSEIICVYFIILAITYQYPNFSGALIKPPLELNELCE